VNNGVFVQDVYGKAGFENSLPKPLLGSTNVIPVPYHLVPSTEWNINYNNLVMVVDTLLIATPTVSFVAAGSAANPWSIEWGDGYIDSFSSYSNTTVSHTYSSRGIFIIQVRGNVLSPRFSSQLALTKISSFAQLTSHDHFTAFRLNTNLVELPRTIPSNITTFSQTFTGTTKLNDPNVSKWNTSNLTNVNSAFFGSAFNQDLGLWNTSNITDMGGLFSQSSFNNGGSDSINNWNTANVTVMNSMFQLTPFNQPLNNWNVSKVTNFSSMFASASSFNSSLSGWALGADTVGTTCNSMFQSATTFNQDISTWDTTKVTNMSAMFRLTAFNQNISGWNVSNVTDMNLMFGNATVFNQPVGSWNVSKVTNMNQMFNAATAFDQDLSSWNLAGLNANTALDFFLGNKTYSTANYNALLIGWNNNKLVGANGVANWRTDLRPNFGSAKYTSGGAAATARAALVSYGWTITDGGIA
jgi:surface protein